MVKFGLFDWGEWLSRLERSVHIREVTGSNPVSPTSKSPQGRDFSVGSRSQCLFGREELKIAHQLRRRTDETIKRLVLRLNGQGNCYTQ